MPVKEKPVILLAGSEQFLKEENLTQIKSCFLDKESADFNFNCFYASSSSADKILECANTLPFLGQKRVVLVRRIEDLSSLDKQFILSYVKAPQNATCLVLETSEGNLNQSFFAEICKYAQVIFCQPPEGKQLFTWIKEQLKKQGKEIEEKAQMLLVENLGNNLQFLSAAITNLILYIGDKETIELSDVEKMVGRDVTTGVFELFNAVNLKNKEEAFQILDGLLENGINASSILGALTYQIISQRNRLNHLQFARSLQELQKSDADIKLGRQNQRFALELLIAKLSELL